MSKQWTDEDVKKAFCWFFEWTFGRELNPTERSQIVAELASGLATQDGTVRELVGYVFDAAQMVLGAPQRHWPKLALDSRAIWEAQFHQPESNGRGRMKTVLATIFAPASAAALAVPVVPPAPMPQPTWPVAPASPIAPAALPVAAPVPAPAPILQTTPFLQAENDMQQMLARLTQERLMGDLRHKIKMMDLQGAQKVLDNWR